tara:strand:+ start:31592 stop:32716 length:1125 start_codon:yes stop_codon:yes gene_type:complete
MENITNIITNIYNIFYSKNKIYEFKYNNYFNILEFVPNKSDIILNQNFSDSLLINCVESFCEKQNIKKFIVSLSGGVDSMVLITILKYLKYEVIGAHINYNNRDESCDEQKFLEEWCEFNNIKLYIKTIDNIKRNNCKRSDYEIITKNIRLDFYKEIIKKENVELVLLAHHKDDIVENIFANVCRGRYILDLAVIKEKTVIANINIGRPMIQFYKNIILDFAEIYQVPYFKDTTPDWSVRGKYRKQIYPLIEDTFTKNVKNNLIALSNQSDEWNQLIQHEIIKPFMNKIKWTIKDYENIVEFNIENYKQHPPCFWNAIFMNIFNCYGYNSPSKKAIMLFINIINKSNKNNTVSNISISNNCKCSIKNSNIKIEF